MTPNLFGIDVSDLDVPGLLAGARAGWVLVGLALAARLLRAGGPRTLLGGVLLGNAWVWVATNFPLARIYALAVGNDRTGNLGLCQVVAAGHSPLHTAQVGQLHFEPFWPLVVAMISGFSPERLLALYPYLALVTALGVVLALERGLRPWPAWERALMAGGFTLLSSSAFDWTGPYRVPWAMTFLLKPNHALGLVLAPLVLAAFVRIRTWRGRVGTGLFLHLLAWAFVLHMVYVAAGLTVFALLGVLRRGRGARTEVLDVGVVILVNLVIVSPYLVMLLLGYPFMAPSPNMVIDPASPHLLEVTARLGWAFPLALWGLRVLHRRGDRLASVWTGQVLAAWLLWVAYLGLSALQLARERDEIDYWLRFLTAATAALGAWDLVRRLAAASRHPWLRRAHARAALLVVLALPWTLPAWWDPMRMDSYFPESLRPLPERLTAPTGFLRRETSPDAVVVADRDYARFVSALGARRVLLTRGLHRPRDYEARWALEQGLVRRTDAESLAEARRYGVQYLVVTPALLATHPGVSLEELSRRPALQRVHLTTGPDDDLVAVFRLGSAP